MIDAHVHLYEFEEEYIKGLKDFIYIFAVSDDFDSCLRTIEISEKFENVFPGIGLHPWEIDKNRVKEILKLCEKIDKPFFLGEIGLDKKFYPESFEKQKKIFEIFLREAKERELPVNLHSAGAWRETLELVLRYDIEKVIFHWYTGPLDVLEEIINNNYFVTFNPAISIQEKQRRILELVPLENILVESDGPYEYRGIFMEPKKVPEVIDFISKAKNVSKEKLTEVLLKNAERFIK